MSKCTKGSRILGKSLAGFENKEQIITSDNMHLTQLPTDMMHLVILWFTTKSRVSGPVDASELYTSRWESMKNLRLTSKSFAELGNCTGFYTAAICHLIAKQSRDISVRHGVNSDIAKYVFTSSSNQMQMVKAIYCSNVLVTNDERVQLARVALDSVKKHCC